MSGCASFMFTHAQADKNKHTESKKRPNTELQRFLSYKYIPTFINDSNHTASEEIARFLFSLWLGDCMFILVLHLIRILVLHLKSIVNSSYKPACGLALVLCLLDSLLCLQPGNFFIIHHGWQCRSHLVAASACFLRREITYTLLMVRKQYHIPKENPDRMYHTAQTCPSQLSLVQQKG